MTTTLNTDANLLAHNDRISQLTREMMACMNLGAPMKQIMKDLADEQAKCEAFGCFDELTR